MVRYHSPWATIPYVTYEFSTQSSNPNAFLPTVKLYQYRSSSLLSYALRSIGEPHSISRRLSRRSHPRIPLRDFDAASGQFSRHLLYEPSALVPDRAFHLLVNHLPPSAASSESAPAQLRARCRPFSVCADGAIEALEEGAGTNPNWPKSIMCCWDWSTFRVKRNPDEAIQAYKQSLKFWSAVG